MLRYFHLENWKSFREAATLDMVATREQRDGDTLAHVHPPKARILPTAAIYGANAAGKSGLVEAINALQQIVLDDRGDKALLPVAPSYHNDPALPTTLEVEFIAVSPAPDTPENDSSEGRQPTGDTTYRYTLVATRKEILSESLVHVRASSERDVFFREGPEVELSRELSADPRTRTFADTVEGNETLLRRLAVRDLVGTEHVSAAFEWFHDRLRVVLPESFSIRMPTRLRTDTVYRNAMSTALSEADTGIRALEFEEVSLGLTGLSDAELAEMEERLLEDGGQWLLATREGRLLILELKEGRVSAEELVTRHVAERGDFRLSLQDESDGTVRYFQLLPALQELTDPDAAPVYVIDELDRSLHSALAAQLVQQFLNKSTNSSRAQFIFTTHDTSLIRRDLLRRDEIWFVGKERLEGSEGTTSELVRLSDLSRWGIRDSTDVFNMYLAGALPGTPELVA